MKKIMTILALMMMTVATVTLVSCSKDDDDTEDIFDGVWHGTVYVSNGDYSINGTVLIECEDGEGVQTIYSSGERIRRNFTYSVGESTITITPDDEDEESMEYKYTYKEKTRKLTLSRSYRENGTTITERYELTKEDEDDSYDDSYDYSYDDSYDDSYGFRF